MSVRVVVAGVVVVLVRCGGAGAAVGPPSMLLAVKPGTPASRVLSDQLVVVNRVSGRQRGLSKARSLDAYTDPRFSPGGRRLLATRRVSSADGTSESVSVVRFDFVGGRLVRRRLVAAGATSPVWSPSGSRIAYVRAADDGSGDLGIVSATLDGTFPTVLTTAPPAASTNPTWSAAGLDYIAAPFTDYLFGAPFGSGPVRRLSAHGPVTVGLGVNSWPQASPHGRYIAVSHTYGTRTSLALLDASGRLTRLTHGQSDITPAWSPDGRYLAFSRLLQVGSHPQRQLAILDRKTKRVTQLGTGTKNMIEPQFVPK